ncbi:MAG: PD-(D/E)XK nuclease family protein [Saprospiraceae bacterium]|nr:PD-(D/E)XK nuclease family protein [Saprospiraceae bacterium]
MNIFKILANGDGSINEANISAFLGYLLNPNEDHGLGYEVLSRFLLANFDDEIYEIESIEQFEFDILFEQAFRSKEDTKKDIVDIVILCYKSAPRRGENIVRNILVNRGQLNKIILIENKINSSSRNEKQLSRQYLKTKSTLEELIPDFLSFSSIKTIYITPSSRVKNSKKNFELEFIEFQQQHDPDSENSNHIKWKSANDGLSLISILKSIISEETSGEIEAINEYTKHTLISFIRYIDNDFKSSFQIKREGKFQKDLFYDLETYLIKYNDNLNIAANNLLLKFSAYLTST